MKVTLYRYIGDSDTANKLLKQCTVIYDKEVIPYGAFNPNGASFRLDTLHDVNYGKFTYNSHDYYGYVDVKTDSKGIYNYTITTDPLTTAWYAGCFNVGNVCKYSDYGTLLIEDPRVTDDSENTWLRYTFDPFEPLEDAWNDWYVVTVLNASLSGPSSKVNTPIFTSYAMNATNFISFLDKFRAFSDIDQYKYASSIVGVYEVRGYEIDNGNIFKSFFPTTTLTLWNVVAINPNASSDASKISPITPKSITFNTNIYEVDRKNTDDQSRWNSSGEYHINTTDSNSNPIVATPDNLDSQFILHVPDCGDIKFTLRNVLQHKHFESEAGFSIYSVGYKKQYDFISGICKAYLVLNQLAGSSLVVSYPQYTITSTMPLRLPVLYDASIQDWKAAKNALITSGVSFATSVAATIGGAAATVATGGVAAPTLIAATASLANAGTNYASSVNAFEHQKFIDENAVASTVGGSGGSVDFVEKPWLIAWYHKSHNLADIQGKFGKPDGLVRVVGNLTGWVQTEACQLPSNGLPFDIITKAEQLANKGFRIVN